MESCEDTSDHPDYAELQRAETLRLMVGRQAVVDTEFDDSDWMDIAACLDMPGKIFFPDDGMDVEQAKEVCDNCEVKGTCLEYAIDNFIEHGVWGGASEKERRILIKNRFRRYYRSLRKG